jgi:hypothetical protein
MLLLILKKIIEIYKKNFRLINIIQRNNKFFK